jgi:hypothetical protein
MLVCDGSKGGAATADEAVPSRNLADLCRVSRPGNWTAVRPGKFHAERIASVAKRVMSTYYGVV